MKLQEGGVGVHHLAYACTLTYRSWSTFFGVLQSDLWLPGRLCVLYMVCVSVCGLCWKRVLAASCVNVRRTWGRSHYHPPYPQLLTPHSAFIPGIPWQEPPTLSFSSSFSLSLYHDKQHIATQPEHDNNKKKKMKDACFLLLLYMKNRQDERMEPNGLSTRGR